MSRRYKKRLQSRMDAVRRSVDQAFADVPYPGDEQIAYSNDPDELKFELRGKHWKEIAPGERGGSHWRQNKSEFLQTIYLGLYMLRPGAFAFYLPVWLIAAMDYYEYGELGDATIRALSPKFWRSQDGFLKAVSKINSAQSRAIHAVLTFVDEFHVRQEPYIADYLNDALRYWDGRGTEGAGDTALTGTGG